MTFCALTLGSAAADGRTWKFHLSFKVSEGLWVLWEQKSSLVVQEMWLQPCAAGGPQGFGQFVLLTGTEGAGSE